MVKAIHSLIHSFTHSLCIACNGCQVYRGQKQNEIKPTPESAPHRA